MNRLKIACFSICIISLFASSSLGSPLVLAGSELNAPPAYWKDSFYPLGQSISRGFPFEIIAGGSYRINELQVIAFHYPNLSGNQATFSLHRDSQGFPGEVLTRFSANNITVTPEVHGLVPSIDILLSSNERYWIVGQTNQQQVNWNLGDSAFGETAFRRPSSSWTHQGENRNIAAYSILGVLVPEPSSAALVGGVTLGFLIRARAKN